MSSARPIQRQPLSVLIAERIREDVLSGAHSPGAQLQETDLAASFGVSRGPLREAMQRLVQEGLLRSEPHRGVFVPDLSEEDILDVFFVRAIVEKAAIGQIIKGGNRAQISETLISISAAMDKAMKSGDDARGGELDFEYHRSLVDAANSERLSRTFATVQAETRLSLHRLMPAYRNPVDLAQEHFRLANLVGDAPEEDVLVELDRHFGDPARLLRQARATAAPGTRKPDR